MNQIYQILKNQLMKKKYMKLCLGLVCAAALILFDQFTKYLAVSHLKQSPAIPIIPGIFELSYLENRGAAFGILQGQKTFLVLMTCASVVIFAYLYARLPEEKRYFFLHMVLVFLTAGAAGNFIDRCARSYVVDFFYFRWIDFPVFNVADIYVTVSVCLLLFLFLFYYKDEELNLLLKQISFQKKKQEKR